MPSPLPELPEIPPEVYESRDRGDLVLFCGAGVSKNAGRPLFGELAGLAEEEFGPSDGPAATALRDKHFDQYFQLLEQGIDNGAPVGRVRKFVQRVLSRKRKSLDVHASILKLARSLDGNIQLVTTNYDRHFEQAAKKLGVRVRTEFAPRLAKPVKGRWNSIVHLHGGLASGDVRDLVLTSGDFGRAYMTERWAARFATEVFENFDVLFLGYSADDVVMRYLLDAYATQPGSRDRGVWAVAAPSEDEASDTRAWTERWEGRAVHLIAYDPKNCHQTFVQALSEWASTIESPASRRTQLSRILDAGVVNLARAGQKSQLKWLLSDATFDCVRSLYVEREGARRPSYVEWLNEFAELKLLEQHAQRGATLAEERQVARSPLVGRSFDQLALGERAFAFAGWLADLALDGEVRSDARSNSELLLEWIQGGHQGAALHPQLADRVRFGLKQFGDRIPVGLREAWTLILDPGVNAALVPMARWDETWDLERDMDANPSVAMVAQRLLHAFTPFLRFRGSSAKEHRRGLQAFLKQVAPAESSFEAEPPSRHDHADSVVVFRCALHQDGRDEHLRQLIGKSKRRDALLREMAVGLNTLLERALTLIHYTQGVPEHFEELWCPSVGSSRDRRGPGAWALLPNLATLAGAELDKAGDRRARALYEAWLAGPHLTQRRLALHAAANWTNLSDEERREALRGHSA